MEGLGREIQQEGRGWGGPKDQRAIPGAQAACWGKHKRLRLKCCLVDKVCPHTEDLRRK